MFTGQAVVLSPHIILLVLLLTALNDACFENNGEILSILNDSMATAQINNFFLFTAITSLK